MGSEVLSLPAGFLVESFSSISHGSESLQKISESFLSPGGVYGRFRRFMLY